MAHGSFSRDGLKRVEESPLEKLFVTDTIAPRQLYPPKVKTISIAELLAKAIESTHQNESVSVLFE